MMYNVRVRTTQNVVIDYPLAGLGDRIVAFLIDALILSAYAGLCWLAFDRLELETDWINMLVIYIPYLLYHLLFEIFMDGQSPGKRQRKIKVVRLDGTSPSIGNYLLRWLFRLIEVTLLQGALAMVTIASSNKGQRLGDVVAGTTVIKLAKQEEVTAEMVFTLVEDTYTPTFASVVNLSDRDIEMIQQALQVNRERGHLKPVMMLIDKLKTMYGIESEMQPVTLLQTVVKDFTMLTAGK
jgi:uncharacterized RDD family membrane protein YckC